MTTSSPAAPRRVTGHLLLVLGLVLGLSDAVGLIHAHAAPDGSDTATPTTIVVDRHGTVRWLYRPGEVIARLSPDEVLQAIDVHIPVTP